MRSKWSQRLYAQAALRFDVEMFKVSLFQRNPFLQKPLLHLRPVAQKNPLGLRLFVDFQEDGKVIKIRKRRMHAVGALHNVQPPGDNLHGF